MEPTKSSSRNIYDNVLACEDLLDKMLLVLPQNREHEWNEIQDYIEDFKRWAEDLGFHTSAGPRFDKCIYPNSNIHEVVLRLLRVLRRNANFALTAWLPKDDISQHKARNPNVQIKIGQPPTPLVLQAALNGVKGAIDRLCQQRADIAREATSLLDGRVLEFPLSTVERQDLLESVGSHFVEALYPNIIQGFQRQLAKSILFRRQRLENSTEYGNSFGIRQLWQQFSRNDGIARSSEQPMEVAYKSDTDYTNAQNKSSPIAGFIAAHESALYSASTWIEPPVTMISTSDAHPTIVHTSPYPTLPYQERTSTHQCHCCRPELDVLHNGELWKEPSRQHCMEALMPYVCISEECNMPLQFFTSQADWLAHMDATHTDDWPEEIHKPMVWFCRHGDETQEYSTAKSLRDHLLDPTAHEEKVSIERCERLLRRNKHRASRGFAVCPLCGEDVSNGWDYPTQENIPPGSETPVNVDSDGDDDATVVETHEINYNRRYCPLRDEITSDRCREKLIDHIARHLELLAFTSLRHIDEELASEDSNDKPPAKRRRLE